MALIEDIFLESTYVAKHLWADHLGYPYPHSLDDRVSAYLRQVQPDAGTP